MPYHHSSFLCKESIHRSQLSKKSRGYSLTRMVKSSPSLSFWSQVSFSRVEADYNFVPKIAVSVLCIPSGNMPTSDKSLKSLRSCDLSREAEILYSLSSWKKQRGLQLRHWNSSKIKTAAGTITKEKPTWWESYSLSLSFTEVRVVGLYAWWLKSG